MRCCGLGDGGWVGGWVVYLLEFAQLGAIESIEDEERLAELCF